MSDTFRSGPYKITTFDLPEAGRSFRSLKINDAGQIAGTDFAHTPIGGVGPSYSFKYRYGLFTNLPRISEVDAINQGGTVFGPGSSMSQSGLIGSNGRFIAAKVAGALGTSPTAINNKDQVVGSYNTSAGTFGFLESRAGAYQTIAPSGAIYTSPDAVSDLGSIVGVYSDNGVAQHGFLYQNGRFTTIDAPGAIFTGPEGVNDLGEVVGYYVQAVGSRASDHGFIYDKGTLTTIDVAGATGTQITGINNLGQFVGHYTNATGDHGFVGQPALSSHPTS